MLVDVVLPIVLAFIMFSLGLGLTGADFSRVWKQPKLFSLGLANQLILLPLVAFGLIKAFDLPPLLAVGTMIIALSPGGVTSNMLTKLAGGSPPLSISLTAVTSLLSVLIVPWMVAFSVRHFGAGNADSVNVTAMGIKMFLITAVPVFLGMILTRSAGNFVKKISLPISRIALGFFVVVVVLAIKANWDALTKHFPALGPTLLLLMLIMLALGLITAKLMRVSSRDATTISLEAGVQNATVGIAVAGFVGTSAMDNQLPDSALPSAVYGVMIYFVLIPFVLWRRAAHRKEANP